MISETYGSEDYFVTMSKGVVPEGVDLQNKDGDSRKTAYVVSILHQFPNIIKAWKGIGLLKRVDIHDKKIAEKEADSGNSVKLRGKDHWVKRKHMAPEHMVTVTTGAVALVDLLVEKGVLEDGSQKVIAEAGFSHDLGKEKEYWYAKLAQECDSSEQMKSRIKELGLTISDEQLSTIWDKESKGERGLVAYDVAGDGIGDILRSAGVSLEAITIQNMVAHHSCPRIEQYLENYDDWIGDNGGEHVVSKRERILSFVMHYLDDIVINPNKIDPEITKVGDTRKNVLSRRMDQNRKNPGYADYNDAWKKHSDRGETAFDMQERVGQMVESKLAEMLGVNDPLTLPALINERVEKNILDFASKFAPKNA